MDSNKAIMISVPCRRCGKTHHIRVDIDDLQAWQSGEKLVQDAFPYLSAEDRELLLTRFCPKCWDEMFGDIDD